MRQNATRDESVDPRSTTTTTIPDEKPLDIEDDAILDLEDNGCLDDFTTKLIDQIMDEFFSTD